MERWVFNMWVRVQIITYDVFCKNHPTQVSHKICFPSAKGKPWFKIPVLPLPSTPTQSANSNLAKGMQSCISLFNVYWVEKLSCHPAALTLFLCGRQYSNWSIWIAVIWQIKQVTSGTYLCTSIWRLNSFKLPSTSCVDLMWILCLNWLILL